jgi:hypothetical protein
MDLSPAESAYFEGENLIFFSKSSNSQLYQFIFLYLLKFQPILRAEKAFNDLRCLSNVSIESIMQLAPESEINFELL